MPRQPNRNRNEERAMQEIDDIPALLVAETEDGAEVGRVTV